VPTWILNGGFESTENGGAPWFIPSDSPTGCTFDIVESSDAANGSHFAKVTCYKAGQGINIFQPFNSIDIGAVYVVSAWMRKLAATANSGGLGCTLGIIGGHGLIASANLVSGAAWQKQVHVFKATAAQTGFGLYCYRASNGGGPDGTEVYTYVDTIEVARLPDRPARIVNGGLEDDAADPAPWHVLAANSTGGTLAVAQTDAVNAAYAGSNYLSIALPDVSTTIYFGLPMNVYAPLRYLVTFWLRSSSAGQVNLNCRLYVSNDDFSRNTYLPLTQSLTATAAWNQRANIIFQAAEWMTQFYFVCTRGGAAPGVVGTWFVDEFSMSEVVS
jgi:hypothetical protein